MSCAADIIKIKDGIHREWFDLQSYPLKIRIGEETLLNKDKTKQIIAMGEEALAKAKECNAELTYTSSLESLLDRIKTKVNSWGTSDYSGLIYYSLTPGEATNFIIEDINKLANLVHYSGYSLIQQAGSFAGCAISSDTELKEVNRASLAYCEGVAHKRGMLMDQGIRVEHNLGIHKNVVKFTEDVDGYDVDMEYTESGHDNWEDRQSGISNTLIESFGLACDIHGQIAKCKGQIKDDKTIRRMAYFLSSVRDIDLLHPDCIYDAIKWAESEAETITEQLKEEAYNRVPKPDNRDQWVEDICGGEVEEQYEEREEREREDSQRRAREDALKGLIESYQINMNERLDDTRKDPCLKSTYKKWQWASDYMPDIEATCRELNDLTGYAPSELCADFLIDQEEKLQEAGETLVRRCPPESLIRNLEAEKTGIALKEALDPIEAVCKAIGAESCLEELSRAIERDIRGIKPEKLPLEYAQY